LLRRTCVDSKGVAQLSTDALLLLQSFIEFFNTHTIG
jgi:hypothetical protein